MARQPFNIMNAMLLPAGKPTVVHSRRRVTFFTSTTLTTITTA